jgi:hypothetical protein
MAIDKRNLKKMFPHLYDELGSSENKVSIDAVRKDAQTAEEEACGETDQETEPQNASTPDRFRHFNPSAVDFIRRCDTEAQAKEIIDYLEKRGEITKENASELRRQLKRDGVRSFGPKKEENHYFKEGGIY